MDNNDLYYTIFIYAKQHGFAEAQRACKRFLREGGKDGTVPTKRKPIKREWVLAAAERQDWFCPRCRLELTPQDLTGDHLVPISEGGKHARFNIRATHRVCNSAKNDRMPMDESKRLGQTIKEML